MPSGHFGKIAIQRATYRPRLLPAWVTLVSSGNLPAAGKLSDRRSME